MLFKRTKSSGQIQLEVWFVLGTFFSENLKKEKKNYTIA